MTKGASRHRRHDPLAIGDKAFLLLELHSVPSLRRNKIDWPKWGPFEVLKISPDGNRIRLDFPKTHRIDWVPAQHVETLMPDAFYTLPPEAQGMKKGEELWEVEKIIGERVYGSDKHRQFVVK
jgi:hypothetical protein